MRTSLGKTWTRDKVVISALELMSLNGVPLTEEDVKWMVSQPEEFMIPELVAKFPLGIRENFETLSAQLQMLLQTATRIRLAIDQGGEDAIVEVMEEEDHGAVKEQILKEAVIQASKEVSQLTSCKDTWVKSTEKRLARLTRAAELAEKAQQELLKVEAQLSSFSGDTKEKTKKALMGFIAGNDKNSLQSAFVNWSGLAVKNRAEREYRKKFEEELIEKETMLMQMRSKAIENVRNALQRKLVEGDADLVAASFREWKSEIGAKKREAQEAEAMRELEAKMSNFTQEQAANAKKVMARMGADNDEAAVVSAFQGWVQAWSEAKADKALEEQVKKAEAQFKEYIEQKKDAAKSMLAKMTASSDSGLLQTCVTGWFGALRELKEERRIAEALNAADGKFGMLKDRQKAGATKLQTRVNEQIKANLLIRVVAAWELISKVNRIDKYYRAKIDGKRKQVDNVRLLFKSFADKLDEGLGNLDGNDSSGRGETRARRAREDRESRGMRKSENSVSLPDIHARP